MKRSLGMKQLSGLLSISVICLSHIRCQKLSKISAKFHCLYRKSGSLSKNMMSDFAPEVAKYTKSSPKPKIAQNSVQGYCLALLLLTNPGL